MVFYKAWMIYDAAARGSLSIIPPAPDEKDAVIALTAEYKPVMDIRFSTGLRLFEFSASNRGPPAALIAG
jgi:hypothetical protein